MVSITEHLPECFETWHIPRKCNICDALRACEQRVAGELLIANTPPVTDQQWIDDARQGGYEDALSEVDKLACGVSFYNLLDERFFFESLHAMKTGKL